MNEMYEVENQNGIFCDAIVTKGDSTVFTSLWGRSGAIMSLYGAITTGSVSSLLVDGQYYPIGKNMNKQQTRMPKHSRYGDDMVHVMLYADVTQTSVAGQRALLFQNELDADTLGKRLWSAIQDAAEIGLLPHWKWQIIDQLNKHEWLRPLEGFGVQATLLDLSNRDAFEQLIQDMIKSSLLQEAA